MEKIKSDKIKWILLSLLMIILAVLVYNIGLSFAFFIPKRFMTVGFLLLSIVVMSTGFIVLPTLLSVKNKWFSSYNVKLSLVPSIIIVVVMFVLNFYIIKSSSLWEQLIVAVCEEYLFRLCLYRILRNVFSDLITWIITAVLFGVFLHLNYPIGDDLLIRIPVSLILSIVATKIGLSYSIGLHWLINILAIG